MNRIITSKTVLVLLVILVMLLVFSGCSKNEPTQGNTGDTGATATDTQQPIELKFGYNDPPNGFIANKAYLPWAEKMEKATNGKVKIVHYPSNTLFKQEDGLLAVETGIADLYYAPLSVYPGRFPLLEVFLLPFLSPEKVSAEFYTRVLNELYETSPEIQEELSDFHILFLCGLESQYIGSREKPIKTLEDMKGLKMITSGQLEARTAENLGATPVEIASADAYDAFSKGIADGGFVLSDMIPAFSFNEVLPYWTKLPLLPSVYVVVMNKEKWESLPSDVQEEINSVCNIDEALFQMDARFGPAAQAEIEERTKEKPITWYSMPADEVARWAAAAQPIWDEWADKLEKQGKPARKILDQVLEIMAMH